MLRQFFRNVFIGKQIEPWHAEYAVSPPIVPPRASPTANVIILCVLLMGIFFFTKNMHGFSNEYKKIHLVQLKGRLERYAKNDFYQFHHLLKSIEIANNAITSQYNNKDAIRFIYL